MNIGRNAILGAHGFNLGDRSPFRVLGEVDDDVEIAVGSDRTGRHRAEHQVSSMMGCGVPGQFRDDAGGSLPQPLGLPSLPF